MKLAFSTSKAFLLGGICLIAAGGALLIHQNSVIIFGFNKDLGTIDGDVPRNLTLQIFNPHLVRANFEVHAPSCTADGKSDQEVTLLPLTSTLVNYPFDPEYLPVGPGQQTVILVVWIGGREDQVTETFHYVVKRMGVTKWPA